MARDPSQSGSWAPRLPVLLSHYAHQAPGGVLSSADTPCAHISMWIPLIPALPGIFSVTLLTWLIPIVHLKKMSP